eukprot:Seg16070.2 transcript_id=Seg16070.2/GoldUCD/mRNA.D3Y31 product="hypothetical protein" protein_id=Seg16070.2/GoldUCD/D3Y31
MATSCRDTPEKLIEDQKEFFIEASDLLEAYDRGAVTEEEVVEELKKLAVRHKDWEKRFKELQEKGKIDENLTPSDAFNNELKPYIERIFTIYLKLSEAGKITPAMEKAME